MISLHTIQWEFCHALCMWIWQIVFIPNRSLGLVVFRSFRRMNFVCLLMSNSELLRIKNKRKVSYKSRKTAKSNLKILTRANARFGFNCSPNKYNEDGLFFLFLYIFAVDGGEVGFH